MLWKFVHDSPKTVLDMGKMTREEYDLITDSVSGEVEEHGKHYPASLFLTDIQFYLYTIGLVIVLMIYWV